MLLTILKKYNIIYVKYKEENSLNNKSNEKFNFAFLNRAMYVGAFIILFYVLKNIGVMDKVFAALAALTPVYIGIIICWITMPLKNKLKKLGLSKGLSAIVSLLIIFGLLIAVISIIVPILVKECTSLVKEFPNIYSSIVEKLNDILVNKLGSGTDFQISPSLKNLEFIQNNIGNILDYSINTVQSIFGVLISIGTTIVVSFFMVKDMDKFKDGVIAFFSKNSKDNNRYKMIMDIDTAIMSYIKGVVIDSFIVGVLTTIVCMVLKLDYAIIFGILIMIFNLIPYLGAILSYAVASLYALSVGGPALAAITFICLLIVQIIDANILQPNIIGKSADLHPVTILAGMIVFELFFGIVGMIIAVPILSVIKVIFKYKLNIQLDVEDEPKIKEPQIAEKNKKVEKNS